MYSPGAANWTRTGEHHVYSLDASYHYGCIIFHGHRGIRKIYDFDREFLRYAVKCRKLDYFYSLKVTASLNTERWTRI